MRILNHRMPVAVSILSAALLSISLITSNVAFAEARESHTDKVNQQSNTQAGPSGQDNNGNQQHSGTGSSTGHSQHWHPNGKHARMNQYISQENKCANSASCNNWAQNILCASGSTCIFGNVVPFLLPWQKEIVR